MTLLLPFIIVVIFSFRDWAFREPNNSSGDLKVSETVVDFCSGVTDSYAFSDNRDSDSHIFQLLP